MNPRETELIAAVKAWIAYFKPRTEIGDAGSYVDGARLAGARLDAAIAAYDQSAEAERTAHEARVLCFGKAGLA